MGTLGARPENDNQRRCGFEPCAGHVPKVVEFQRSRRPFSFPGPPAPRLVGALDVAKGIRRKDDAVYGISAAANYLECAEATVLNHANAGRLVCTRDSSGKRLFAQSELAGSNGRT